jgi:hypothetical protein
VTLSVMVAMVSDSFVLGASCPHGIYAGLAESKPTAA